MADVDNNNVKKVEAESESESESESDPVQMVSVPGWDEYLKNVRTHIAQQPTFQGHIPGEFKNIDIPIPDKLSGGYKGPETWKPVYMKNNTSNPEILNFTGVKHDDNDDEGDVIEATTNKYINKQNKKKCTCPIKINTGKKKSLYDRNEGMNGYRIQCPIHGLYKKERRVNISIG